jgi:Chain length determinant protein.
MENINTSVNRGEHVPNPSDFLFVKKHKVAILVTFCMVFICFVLYAIIRKPTYTSNFAVTSTIFEGVNKNVPEGSTLKHIEFEQLVSNFNLLYNYKNNFQSDSIKVDKILAANTKSFKIVSDKPDEISYRLRITVFDPKYVVGLTNCFVDYLNNTSSFKDKLVNERKRKEDLLKVYDNQIREMQVSRDKTLTLKSNVNINTFNIDLDVTNLTEKRSELYNALLQDKRVTVNSNPVIPIEPDGLNVIELLLLGIIISLVLAIFVGYIMEYNKTGN